MAIFFETINFGDQASDALAVSLGADRHATRPRLSATWAVRADGKLACLFIVGRLAGFETSG